MNSVIILEDLVFKSTLSRRKRILDNQIRSRGGLMVTPVVFRREEADRAGPAFCYCWVSRKKIRLSQNGRTKILSLKIWVTQKALGDCMNKYPVVQGWLQKKAQLHWTTSREMLLWIDGGFWMAWWAQNSPDLTWMIGRNIILLHLNTKTLRWLLSMMTWLLPHQISFGFSLVLFPSSPLSIFF